MIRSGLRTVVSRRWYSTETALTVESARDQCIKLLSEQDRSSYVLRSYIPAKARDAFIAVRAFNLETARAVDSASRVEFAKMKIEFWKSVVQKALSPSLISLKSVPAEPVAVLLGSAALNDKIQLSKRFLITLLQTRETYASNPPFRNVDAMASYGEGTYSQLNYLTQEALYSVSPKVTEFLNEHPPLIEQVDTIMAHIGQATGIATFLRGFEYFARHKDFVALPVDMMTRHGVSQEAVLNYFRGNAEHLHPGVSEVVYETATRANDHIISARTLLDNLRETLKGSIPDAMFVPAMNAIPVVLYLEKLEKHNFDVTNRGLKKQEWRLPYRSFKAYKLRRF
ncbi:hypothetical protein TRVA0_008S02762 [Trichomonascus vanleenenianus]|uniref:uncharacterized protein n=1 Tax=Trichomonascus vanleenenianus TaxID=2268995 RepID=UPI003EC96586